MPIEILEDPSRPPGHARIVVKPGLANGQAIEGVRIGRHLSEREPEFLGEAGWHGKASVASLREIERTESQAIFLIGPEIVDRIPPDTRVSVEIVGAGRREDLFWPPIAMSPAKDKVGFVLKGNPRNASIGLKESGPPPNPVNDDATTRTVIVTGVEPVDPPPPVEPPSRRLRFLWAALVLIAVAGIGGYYFLVSESGDVNLAGVPSPTGNAANWTERYGLLQQTDEGGGKLRELYEEIAAAPSPDLDTAFRALDLAAQRGDGEAAMLLAGLYDPATFDARFFNKPNPLKAHDWYAKASAASVEAAVPARDRLCAAAASPPSDQAELYSLLSASGKCN